MKKEVSPGVIIGILAVVVIVIGFFVFKSFFKDPNYSPVTAEEEKQNKQVMSQSAIAKRLGRARTPGPGAQPSGQ